jgi:heme A synthase
LHTVGSVTAVVGLVIYLVVAVWSMRRLRTGRSSWLVPLIAGVVVNLGTGIAVIAVIMSDPSFAAYMQSSAG